MAGIGGAFIPGYVVKKNMKFFGLIFLPVFFVFVTQKLVFGVCLVFIILHLTQ